jgi:hypothetical protein
MLEHTTNMAAKRIGNPEWNATNRNDWLPRRSASFQAEAAYSRFTVPAD